jgi:hypothetical protein
MSDGDTVQLREHLQTLIEERSQQYADAIRHLTDRLQSLKEYIEAKFLWLERSTSTTAGVMEKRLEGMNEFRDALKDLTARLASREELDEVRKQLVGSFSRTEHEAFMRTVDSDIRTLRESRAELKGMATQTSVVITFILASIGAISGLAVLVREMLR